MRINSKAYRNMMNTMGKLMEEVIHCKEELNRMEKELTELKNRPTLNVDLLKEDMEEDRSFKCIDCISMEVGPSDEPCISCMFNPFNHGDGVDKFYPNMECVCDVCKHVELLGDEYPCNKCVDGDRWEE